MNDYFLVEGIYTQITYHYLIDDRVANFDETKVRIIAEVRYRKEKFKKDVENLQRFFYESEPYNREDVTQELIEETIKKVIDICKSKKS